MSTYKNCYELVRDTRQGVDEYDDALASGEDIVGGFRNDFIVEQINQAIIELFGIIARRRPQEFIKETPIVGINSAYALPADFGKLVLFRDQYGQKVWSLAQRERRMIDQTGSERLYYQRGRNLFLDCSGVTSTYTLIYMPIARTIHMGKFGMTAGDPDDTYWLQADRRKSIDDYYNGMTLENVKQKWADVIEDYDGATGECTFENESVPAQHDLYGLVPDLPEWAHSLIAPRAIILAKSNPITKMGVSRIELDNYRELLRATLVQYASESDDDQDWDELFSNYAPNTGGTIL